MIISIIGTEKDKGLKKSFMYKKKQHSPKTGIEPAKDFYEIS